MSDGPSAFTGVSCYTGGCTAVGWEAYNDGTPTSMGNAFVIENWNGSKWALAGSWPPDTSDTPTGVHCESATDCTVVGWLIADGSASDAHDTLVAAWNGTSWTEVPAPDPNVDYSWPGQGDGLNAIACVSGGAVCTAVGQQEDPNSPSNPPDSLAIRN